MATIEVRLFNSLSKYARPPRFQLTLDNPTVAGALQALRLPESEIFLLLHNGRNIMRGFGFNSGIETEHRLTDGDVLAFSGPVPFSRGYGAPVV